MKRKTEKTQVVKEKIVAEISYRIFELSSEGHLKEPMTHGYDGEEHIFDSWNGYPSIEEARLAVENDANNRKFGGSGLTYIILPMVKTR